MIQVVIVSTNCLEDSKLTVKNDARWNPHIKCDQKGGECTTVNYKTAEELGWMKVSTGAGLAFVRKRYSDEVVFLSGKIYV